VIKREASSDFHTKLNIIANHRPPTAKKNATTKSQRKQLAFEGSHPRKERRRQMMFSVLGKRCLPGDNNVDSNERV
jgi:hypothetical protein